MLLPFTESTAVLRSLTHLSDDQIDAVIDAVTNWCRTRGVTLESDEGRRAVSVAADFISNRNVPDFREQISAELAREFGDV